MVIEEKLLSDFGAKKNKYLKGTFLFREGELAKNYYQLKTGEVAMVNFNEKGDEFVQGIFHAGDSFGEPPLFGNFPYPAAASCYTDVMLWSLSRDRFIELLKSNFDLHFHFTSLLSTRLMYKATMMREIATEKPEHRILRILNFYKNPTKAEKETKIDLTRQQIANLTGLRVETVIRSMKKLAEEDIICIERGKVFI